MRVVIFILEHSGCCNVSLLFLVFCIFVVCGGGASLVLFFLELFLDLSKVKNGARSLGS